MTYQRLEEYLLKQNYDLLCEMLFYQLILYKAILWYKASFTFQIKRKNMLDTLYSSTTSQFHLFQRISKDERKNHPTFIL